jgi:hypothetical protein
MKPEQSVYNKLHKLSAKEPMKMEFSALDDLKAKYDSVASRSVGIKNAILKEANNLAAVATSLGTIKGQFEKIESSAKELGIEIPSAYKAMVDASQSLAKDWGKSANKIANAAKEM